MLLAGQRNTVIPLQKLTSVFMAVLKIKFVITLLHAVQLYDSRQRVHQPTLVVEMLLYRVCSDINKTIIEFSLLAGTACTTPEKSTKTGKNRIQQLNGD